MKVGGGSFSRSPADGQTNGTKNTTSLAEVINCVILLCDQNQYWQRGFLSLRRQPYLPLNTRAPVFYLSERLMLRQKTGVWLLILSLSHQWARNRKWCISMEDLLSHTVRLSSHRGASWWCTPPILHFYSMSLSLCINPNPRPALGGVGGSLKVGVFPQSHLPITLATQLNGTPRHPLNVSPKIISLTKCSNRDIFSVWFEKPKGSHAAALIIIHFISAAVARWHSLAYKTITRHVKIQLVVSLIYISDIHKWDKHVTTLMMGLWPLTQSN